MRKTGHYDQNPIRFEYEMDLGRDGLKNIQKVRTVERGFITADSDLIESSLFSNGEQVLGDFRRQVEPTDLFRLINDLPRPTEKAS